jgi:UV DNA damage repair endonuclease
MSEQAMSAEKVRAVLTENLERVRKASNEYFQMLEKGLSSSQLPIADHAKPLTMQIQSEFFQAQIRAATDQARTMGGSAMKAMTGAFDPKR